VKTDSEKKQGGDGRGCEGVGIFLNSLYYDRREVLPEYFVKFSGFFHEEVNGKKKERYISENIESIFITTFGF
jgi:hypothetical protein